MSSSAVSPVPAEEPPVAVTAGLGRWVAELTLAAIPGEVLAHIKRCLLDALGCGFYGVAQPWSRIAADTAVELSGGGAASLLGRAEKVGPGDAAMANGTAIHGFELDDLHAAGMCHPGAVTVPACLAVAEARGSSGADLLAALVAGYEAGIRVGICAGVPHGTSGYHGTGTIGTLCSSAAVARLLRLDGEGAMHALGIGATQAAGLYAARKGAMSKRLHAGHAAQSGVLAGLLASRGFTGSTEAIEAPFGGFMGTLRGGPDLAGILDGLGDRWETLNVGFKIYAACGSTHTTLGALHALMAQGLSADNLDRLTVWMTRKALTNVAWPYVPTGVAAAQMNGYFTAAIMLVDGQAFIDQYTEDRLADPRVLALIPRVELLHDPALDLGGAARRHAIRIEVRLKDGRVFRLDNDRRRGSAESPLSDAEIEGKFRRLSDGVLTPASADAVVGIVGDLERQSDLSGLWTLLRAA